MQFDWRLDAFRSVSRELEGTFVYLQIARLPRSCPDYLHLVLAGEYTFIADFDDASERIVVPNVLSCEAITDFLVNDVFKADRSRGDLFVLYEANDTRPISRMSVHVTAVTVERFKCLSSELIQGSNRVTFHWSDDAINLLALQSALFPDSAVVDDLVRYILDVQPVPPDTQIRVLTLEDRVIGSVPSRKCKLRKLRNPLRVEKVPDDQANVADDDFVIVIVKGNRKQAKVSFMLHAIADEEFAQTKCRIEEKLDRARNAERGIEWRYTIKVADQSTDLFDGDSLMSEMERGAKLYVRPAGTQIACFVARRTSTGASVKLLN